MPFFRFHVPTELRNFEQGKTTSVSLSHLVCAIRAGQGGRYPTDEAAYLTRKLREPETRLRLGL